MNTKTFLYYMYVSSIEYSDVPVTIWFELFSFVDGSLVWCDDTLDKIDIVSMITLTSSTVISNRGEYPVSVAVLGEFIYYIARDRR